MIVDYLGALAIMLVLWLVFELRNAPLIDDNVIDFQKAKRRRK